MDQQFNKSSLIVRHRSDATPSSDVAILSLPSFTQNEVLATQEAPAHVGSSTSSRRNIRFCLVFLARTIRLNTRVGKDSVTHISAFTNSRMIMQIWIASARSMISSKTM
jgi:hypothetical protein